MELHLKNLNERQRKAVLKIKGPLLIVAGAGAGKTKTITHRIVHLIHTGVLPEEIIAVTFTNKAAQEMKQRVSSLLRNEGISTRWGYDVGPAIYTFHSLGVQIIRDNAHILDIKKHFIIFDRNDSIALIKKVMKEVSIDAKEYEPRKILSIISKQKGRGNTYTEFLNEEHTNYFMNIVGEVWEDYEQKKQELGALDFDDLLLKTLLLLKNHKDIRDFYKNKWKYIHIDEYQDTNLVQYKIIKLLIGKEENICVVGDVDQAIYSWRGADYSNILNFEKDFSNIEVVLLEENYRSTKTIIAASNDIIAKNINRKEKTLYTNNISGEKITVYVAPDEVTESLYVAQNTKHLIELGVSPEQIAVLYRTNFLSRVLEEAFLSNGIIYQVLGTRFFERKEIKDMIAYLRASIDPKDITSIGRIINMPKRGIGKVSIAKIAAGQYNELSQNIKSKVDNFFGLLEEIQKKAYIIPLDKLFRFILEKTDLEDILSHGTEDEVERLENIYELVTISAKYNDLEPEVRIQRFLDDAALMTSEQDQIKAGGGVKLMTVHAAKGLEFSHVFIVGLEEGLFPHDSMGDTSRDEEEERRLFYVALTRAKEKLFLSYAHTRTIYGHAKTNVPSEFLLDIKDKYIEKAKFEHIISI